MSNNKRIETIELSTPVVERCSAAIGHHFKTIDPGYWRATSPIATAALLVLEDGMVLGIRSDGKWLQVKAVEPFVLADGRPITLETNMLIEDPA